jgi:hypothetical protein
MNPRPLIQGQGHPGQLNRFAQNSFDTGSRREGAVASVPKGEVTEVPKVAYRA